jgi:hypothetical protein
VLDRLRGRLGLSARRIEGHAARRGAAAGVVPNVPNVPGPPLGALSGGDAQNAPMAGRLQTRPRLVLPVEPAQGVDVGARRRGREALGERLLFVGRGGRVARLSGVGVVRMRAGAFVVSGLVAAPAGVLYTGMRGAADPSAGLPLLLPAFAAAFLGSTSIQPGRFDAPGRSWRCSSSRRG